MEEIKQANDILNNILNGHIKADNAPVMVQHWLQLTIYNLANEAATKPSKQARAAFLDNVMLTNPLFYDDVSSLAKQIYKELNK